MKNKIAIFVIVLLAIVILLPIKAGWLKSSTPSDAIKIGVTAPLTGPLAEYGEAYKNGINMAMEDSKATDKNISFIFEDHQYDGAKAISAFNKLVSIDKVKVVADWGTGSSYAIAPLVKANNDIIFITNSIDPAITKESDRIIRNFYNPEEIAATLWGYFRSKGYKHIGVVKINILYFSKVTEALVAQAKPDEKVMVIDTISDFGVTDLRSSVIKTKGQIKYIDTLGIFLGSGQISSFYKQLDQAGIKTPTFGSDFFESQTEVANAGGLMDGAIYANIGASPEFINHYEKKFGNSNQVSFAASGYDLAKILIEKINYQDTASIMTSLKNIHNYPGAIGGYSFTETATDRYLKSPVKIKEVSGKLFKVISI